MRRRAFILACLAVGGAIVVAGAQAKGERRAADPGVTATTLTIGGSVPLSGVASAYASVGRGADAYFKYANSRGGVNGRRITYKFYDDQYNPAETVQQTRKLVQEDNVFAIFNTLGTEHNLAIRPFLNQLKVPQIFPATGATQLGTERAKYPSTTAGFILNYLAEGRIYGKAIGQQMKKARVAVLYQNDDYGKDLLNGLRQGLRFAGKGGTVVATQSYELTDTDVSSQISKLRGSRANFLVIVATPRPTIQAYIAVNKLGWKPRIIVNAVSAATNTMKIAELSSNKRTDGSISLTFLKDPTDPRWAKDAGTRLYRTIFRRYGQGDINDVYNVYAMASAFTFLEALKKAGRTPTRTSMLRALNTLNVRNNPFLLPGVVVQTSARDPFPIEQAQVQRWKNGRWVPFGKLITPQAGT